MKPRTAQPLPLQQALDAFVGERQHQDEKHGTAAENPHTIGEWILIIEAELAEAKEALIKDTTGQHSVMREILQVGASALAAIEEHGL